MVCPIPVVLQVFVGPFMTSIEMQGVGGHGPWSCEERCRPSAGALGSDVCIAEGGQSGAGRWEGVEKQSHLQTLQLSLHPTDARPCPPCVSPARPRPPPSPRPFWGLLEVYNKLGSHAQRITAVSDFQQYLQNRLKRLLRARICEDWTNTYSSR